MKTLQKRSVDTAAVLTLVLLFLRRSCPLISLLALALNARKMKEGKEIFMVGLM